MAIRGAEAQSVTAKSTDCGFDPHSRKYNIYLKLNFHFFAMVSRQSAALNSATQHTMSSDFSGKGVWSVLTQGSLCLPFVKTLCTF